MMFDQKRCDEVIRQYFEWKQLVSFSIGSKAIKAWRIEAFEEEKTIVHSKTVVLISKSTDSSWKSQRLFQNQHNL